MKVLILSDLHLASTTLTDKFYLNKEKRIIDMHLGSALKEADLVVISGDVVEASIIKAKTSPLEALYKLFEKEVIFCLGNHEFAYQRHPDVIDFWKKWKHDKVHCLDIDGRVEIGNYNFVGNVLWYDFSLNKNQLLMKGEIVEGWLDSTIQDFDPLIECQLCKEQIFKNLSKDKKNILITHMVPHIDLNTFSKENPYSIYNAYSGCERFLLDCQDSGCAEIEYAICGHTHRRECKEIWNVKCMNIGNDYFHRTHHIVYEVIELS